MTNPYLKLLLGLAIGIIPTIWILQKNPIVKKISIKTVLSALENELDSKVSVESASFNFLKGTIDIHHAVIKPRFSNDIYVTFEEGQIRLSRRSYLIQSILEMFTTLKKVSVHTRKTNDIHKAIPLLTNPMKTKQRKLPVKLKALTIEDMIIKSDDGTTIDLPSKFFFQKQNNGLWKGAITFLSSSISYQKNAIITKINGPILFNQYNFNQGFTAQGNLSFSMPSLSEPQCKLDMTVDPNGHKISLENQSKELSITIAGNNQSEVKSTGTIELQNHSLCKKGTASVQLRNQVIDSTFSLTTPSNIELEGTAKWNMQPATGNITLTNSTNIEIPNTPITINHKNIQINAKINKSFALQGNYKTTITNVQNAINTTILGNFFLKNNLLNFSGSSTYGSYSGICNLNKKPYLSKFILRKGMKKSIQIDGSTKGNLKGKVSYGFINSILKTHYKYALLGNKGSLIFDINFNDTIAKGSISFKNGTLYIPSIENLVTNFASSFKFETKSKTLSLKNVQISFKQGSISSSCSVIQFDKKYNLKTIYFPLSINDMFLCWKKDFLGIIYGNLILQKVSPVDIATLNGNVVLKKTLLRENIFSNLVKKDGSNSFSLPLSQDSQELICKLSITNEQPITAKTSFLNASADINLNVIIPYKKHSYLSPQVVGNVTIRGGSFDFLRNKLLISSGKMHFLPNQAYNPILNIIAKNKIKKYFITLQITGPTENPTILLESNPELTEEQILGLLLAGSEYSLLQSDFPTMIMQNLNNLITGRKNTLTNAMNFFKTITKPLKYIQVTPNFTDQSGRGGIKGSLSIDLNKRLHAHIQKNLSTQEDLSFQIEYFITDDLNIKAVRDQRGDIGAEIELRIKP
jgi:hypothetical protein